MSTLTEQDLDRMMAATQDIYLTNGDLARLYYNDVPNLIAALREARSERDALLQRIKQASDDMLRSILDGAE